MERSRYKKEDLKLERSAQVYGGICREEWAFQRVWKSYLFKDGQRV